MSNLPEPPLDPPEQPEAKLRKRCNKCGLALYYDGRTKDGDARFFLECSGGNHCIWIHEEPTFEDSFQTHECEPK